MHPRPCRPRPLTRLLACVCAVAWSASCSWAAGGTEDALAMLLKQVSAHTQGRATFIERQYLALLKTPVESEGELRFTPPARLEKRTLRPAPELLIVDNGTLTITRANRTQSIALRQYPQLAVFIDSFRATLSGDRAALEQTYRPQLQQTGDTWVLTLVPRDPKLAAIVKLVRISGRDDEVRTVETIRADGDRSVMEITPSAEPG